jgi:hypothetical protein
MLENQLVHCTASRDRFKEGTPVLPQLYHQHHQSDRHCAPQSISACSAERTVRKGGREINNTGTDRQGQGLSVVVGGFFVIFWKRQCSRSLACSMPGQELRARVRASCLSANWSRPGKARVVCLADGRGSELEWAELRTVKSGSLRSVSLFT